MNGAKIVKKIIDLIHVFTSLIFHFQFSVFNFQFYFGRSVSAYSYAVGLSAISFSAALQKDAAPIPNALGAMSIEPRAMSLVC